MKKMILLSMILPLILTGCATKQPPKITRFSVEGNQAAIVVSGCERATIGFSESYDGPWIPQPAHEISRYGDSICYLVCVPSGPDFGCFTIINWE